MKTKENYTQFHLFSLEMPDVKPLIYNYYLFSCDLIFIYTCSDSVLDSESLGPYCKELQICKSSFFADLEKVEPQALKNGHLIEIYRHVKSGEIPWAEVQQALLVGSPQDWTNIPRWMVPTAFTAVYRKH